MGGEVGGYQPQVTEAAEQFRDLSDRRGKGLGDGRHHQFLAETDLDRLEERDQPSLDQIGERLNLIDRALLVKLGERLHQLVPAGG